MAGSREVKGEAVGQGQGKCVSDRDNFTDPGESVTTSEVGGGINSKEEGEKGIRVERMDGQGVGRKERCDGGKERSRDRGEGVAVENDMESVPKGGRRGTEGAEPLGVEAVTARRGGEMEVGGEQASLTAETEERKGGVVGQGREIGGGPEEVATHEFGRGKGEIGAEARGNRRRGGEGPKAQQPETSDHGAEGTGISTFSVSGEGQEDLGGEVKIVPQREGAKEVEAAAHGKLERGQSRAARIRSADGKHAVGKGVRGEQVETTV